MNSNYITGEINVKRIGALIQIINSYEKLKEKLVNVKEEENLKNEEEIRKSIIIEIENEILAGLAYTHEFEEKRIYKIKYSFRNKLTKINHLFTGCTSIIKLDFTHFDTREVTDMSNMFWNCQALTELNLSNFNTEKVTNMKGMFNNCESLIKLDLSNFKTKQVTDMSKMFTYCKKLKELNISHFNTENVINMEKMFFCCEALKILNVSNFNTEKVTNMKEMFNQCSSLKVLDVSNFKINENCLVSNMLYLPKLKKLIRPKVSFLLDVLVMTAFKNQEITIIETDNSKQNNINKINNIQYINESLPEQSKKVKDEVFIPLQKNEKEIKEKEKWNEDGNRCCFSQMESYRCSTF